MFFKKRSILRRSIEQQVKLIDTLKKECQQGKISTPECSDIMNQWGEISTLLQKIAPPEPLTKHELLIRGGAIGGIFCIMLIGVIYITFSRNMPVGESVVQNITSEGVEFQHVPEERVKTDETRMLQESTHSGRFSLERIENLSGTVVGIVPHNEALLNIFFTKNDRDRNNCLFAVSVQRNTMIKVDEKIVLDLCEIVDVSIVRINGGYLLAYGAMIQDQSKLYFLTLDENLDLRNPSTEIEKFHPQEVYVGLSLTHTSTNEYVLVTTQLRDENDSVAVKTVPIVRQFDSSLQLQKVQSLETKGYNLAPFMSADWLENGGLNIFSNGRNPLTASSDKGDELYLFTYSTDWKLTKIIQITNNGRKDDFQPSQVIQEKPNVYFIPSLQTEVPQEALSEITYPPNTGQMFIRILADQTSLVGSINVEQYTTPSSPEDRLEGGKNIHLYLDGYRLYIVHDAIIQRDQDDKGSGGDGEYREIRYEWFDVHYF